MTRFPFSFAPFRTSLYTCRELFVGLDPRDPQSYAATHDFAVYREYIASGKYAPSNYFAAMMQALHDNGITQALREFLETTKAQAVGVMGGHELLRGSEPYRNVVYLSRELVKRNFTMLSGGGPGAMEATHLGAALVHASDEAVEAALAKLAVVPKVPDLANLIGPDGEPDPKLVAAAHEWFAPAYEIAVSVEHPGASVAIPTWLYGHEPSSPFASHIAKYFQNSIREDGLLAVAGNGVIYVEGRAGTLQEIFQDAAQNYYRTFGAFSPMVFLGRTWWTETLPAVGVLKMLFTAEEFERYVLITDDIGEAADFIQSHVPKEDASQRMNRYFRHEVRR
jgi:predicted Rossmann-fold nucleotide-binding protein